MLKKVNDSGLILVLMKNLNFLILIFISLIMSYSLNGIIRSGDALDFLNKVNTLTLAPWKLPLIVICLYISLLFLMSLQDLQGYQIWFRLIIEIVLSFLIVYIIGFSYIGIFLLLLAVSVDYLPKSKWRIPFIIFLCIAYFSFEYGVFNC